MGLFTPDQNKKLVEIYPYLQPRNIYSDKIPEQYDYSYIRGDHELPEGWMRLFLLYCKAIRSELVKTNYLNKFRFSQIKEKYGSMRLYNLGYPASMADIEWAYCGYSEFVCQRCGNIAKKRTINWIENLCLDCYAALGDEPPAETIVKHRTTKIYTYSTAGKTERTISYHKLNKEYMECLKMTDAEFFEYITKEENYAPEKH